LLLFGTPIKRSKFKTLQASKHPRPQNVPTTKRPK
jgi:hypothetical protein